MSKFLAADSGHAVVILLQSVRTHNRFMGLHGPYGALRALPIATALRLCEAGDARLPGDADPVALRRAYKRQCEAREPAEVPA